MSRRSETKGPLMRVPAQETVTVSVVIKDHRGFTHFYEDFVTTPQSARRVLQELAAEARTATPSDSFEVVSEVTATVRGRAQ